MNKINALLETVLFDSHRQGYPSQYNELRKKFLSIISKNCHEAIQSCLINNHIDAFNMQHTDIIAYMRYKR